MPTQKKYIGETDWVFIVNLIHTEFMKYVKAVQGKGLSTNDFTNELKSKLEGIDLSNYAALAGAVFTGTVQAPTAAAGTNNTTVATTAFVTAAIAAAISSISGIRFDADTTGQGYLSLADLQTKHPTGENGVIYLVQNGGSGSSNSKDEYFWYGSGYEKFGTTDIDLSGYLQDTDVIELTTTEIQTAWDSVFNPS